MSLQPITDAVNAVLRDSAPDTRVPYARLRAAASAASARFPDANSVKALWTPANAESDIVVEVWTGSGRHARATTWTPNAADCLAPA